MGTKLSRLEMDNETLQVLRDGCGLMYAAEDVIATMEGKDPEEASAYGETMVAAFNACFSTNPEHPEKVAQEIEAMFRFIDTMANDPDSFDMQTVAREIFARLQDNPDGEDHDRD